MQKLQFNVHGLKNSCYMSHYKFKNTHFVGVCRLKLVKSILLNAKLLRAACGNAVYLAVYAAIHAVVKGSEFSIIKNFHCIRSVFWA